MKAKLFYIIMHQEFRLFCLWGILAIILTSTTQLSPFFTQVPYSDSAIFITCAQWIKEGVVMYRDIFDHKGIFIYLFDIVGLSIGGFTGIWVLCLLWHILSTLFIYKICRLFTNEKASAISSVIALMMIARTGADNTVELASLPFISYLYWIAIFDLQKNALPKAIESFFIGVCTTIIILLKPNIIVGALIPFIFLIWTKRNNYHKVIIFLAYAIIGAIITAAPFFLYLLNYDTLNDFYSTFWLFNIEYSSKLGLNQTTRWCNFGALLFLYIPSLLSWIAVYFVSLKESRDKTIWALVLWIIVSAYFNAGLSGFKYGHYLLPVFPIFSIFIAKLFILGSKICKVIQTSFLAICFLYFSFQYYQSYCNITSRLDINKDTISLSDYIKKSTNDTDKIVIWGKDANLFYLSERKCVSKYIYQSPIFNIRPNMKNEFIESIITQRPKMIITGTNVELTPDVSKYYIKIESEFNDVIIYSRQ